MLCAAGCRTSNCDLVEAELRTRNNQVRELKEELWKTEAYNGTLQREMQALRQGGAAGVSPELAAQVFTIKEITLGRQTGGFDEDGRPGDEALQVVVEPRDLDGQPIKAPGTLHVTALEVSPQGLKMPVGTWDLRPDQLRRTWKSGLFATGYFVILPWKTWPASDRIRVVAQFTLADGRVFEADRDVRVRLPAVAPHLVPGEQLPPPSPVETGPNLDLPPVAPPPRKTPPVTVSLRPAELLPPRPAP